MISNNKSQSPARKYDLFHATRAHHFFEIQALVFSKKMNGFTIAKVTKMTALFCYSS